jgi:hypothetical protein
MSLFPQSDAENDRPPRRCGCAGRPMRAFISASPDCAIKAGQLLANLLVQRVGLPELVDVWVLA